MDSHSDSVRTFNFNPSALKFYGSTAHPLGNSPTVSRPDRLEAFKLQVGEEEVMDSVRQTQEKEREREQTASEKHNEVRRNQTDRDILMETNGRHSPEPTNKHQISIKTETQLSPMGIQRKYQQRIDREEEIEHDGEEENEDISPDSRVLALQQQQQQEQHLHQHHRHHLHEHPAPTSEKTSPSPGSQEWTFEEQFKQLYELTDDPKRKEFLDDLFSYMQKRGTPVNRIPIMAKQTLDLYELFKLVVSKGGLVEVINKKLWREITKGLNLPSSITSAAFTLRTQYMKYLYPFECDKLKLSSPMELQAAIDGNRREGRRPSYSSSAYLQSPGSPPPSMVPQPMRIPNNTGNNGSLSMSSGDDDSPPSTPTHRSLHNSQMFPSDIDGPPPPKRQMLSEEQIRQIQQLQSREMPQSAHIKMTSTRDSGMPMLELRGDNSLIVSIELNGVLYQGILYARGTPGHPLHPGQPMVNRPSPL
ncbi:protein dead ringer homolog [Glandiceps talaboti]